MKNRKISTIAGISMAMMLALSGCRSSSGDTAATIQSNGYTGGAATADTGAVAYYDSYYDPGYDMGYVSEGFNTEEYDAVKESGFASVIKSPLSTFGADVDTASYANIRRMLNYGYKPEDIPEGAVRAEEMVNYFSYSYNGPEDGEPFGVNAAIAKCPWNEENLLLHLG